jgi:hypothetical protein
MPAVSRLAACREEMAELEDLLVQLQEVPLESSMSTAVSAGSARRTFAAVRNIFMQTRSDIAVSCRNLLKVAGVLPANLTSELGQLADLLEISEPTEKEQTVLRIAVKWTSLKPKLLQYSTVAGTSEEEMVAKIQVTTVISQMDRYAQHWKKIFASANPVAVKKK